MEDSARHRVATKLNALGLLTPRKQEERVVASTLPSPSFIFFLSPMAGLQWVVTHNDITLNTSKVDLIIFQCSFVGL